MARHPVIAYIHGVLEGTIPACEFVRRAAQRHLDDMEHARERGLWFDRAAAEHVVRYFGFLRHSKGEWAGEPFDLEPWQQFILWMIFGWKRDDGTRRYRNAYVEVPRKNGKSTLSAGIGLYLLTADGEPGAEVYSAAPLDIDTILPTPSGYTTMGKVKEGDRVFDEAGTPRLVTYVSPVMYGHKCYEVLFSDGAQVVADAEHRWQTEVYSSGRSLEGRRLADYAGTREKGRTTALYTTDQIKDTLQYECKKDQRANHRIPVAGPLELPEQCLPIGPYTLGVWLGDGRNNRGAIVVHPDDAEIAKHVRSEGYVLSEHGADDEDGLLRFTILGLRTALRENDLLENKHIPVRYLRASSDQRANLLRGLMDTDGTVTKNGECRFTNRNARLAYDATELIAGLGLQPHCREVEVASEPYYIVSFKAYASDIRIANLTRKYERQKTKPDSRAKNRYITEVNPVKSRPVRCISVDSPSHLYLVTRSLIATHNTKRDQARITHSEATRMVRASPALKRMVKIYKDNLHIPETACKYEPLGADANSMDGLNIHGAMIDEVHAHRTSAVIDVLDTATGARRQPLVFEITTAGYDRQSICWEHHEYTRQVLEGLIQDDTWFGYIATIDEGDDWKEASSWIKANPNYGVSVKPDDLRAKANKAAHMPAAQNAFLRLHLNVWTQQSDRWIDIDLWDANAGAVDEADLAGRKCYGGLDLSAVSDLGAWVLVFPDDDDPDSLDILARFWCPEARLVDDSNKYKEQYQEWARGGWLTATPGDAVDYQFIKRQILSDAETFRLEDLNIDRLFQAYQLSMELQDEGLTVFGMGQGFLSMAVPVKEFEKRLLERKLRHGGNPVLRWMAGNVAVKQDAAGNLKPDKAESQGKIDGIVALIMALDRAMRHQAEGGSVYEERGILVL